MFPAKFDYYRATSVQNAVDLLQQYDDAKVMAGGHSLLPAMKLRLSQPAVIVDIGRVAELSGVTQNNGTLRIGALTTHHEVANSALVQQHCALLAEAAGNVGDPAVRHKGTLGGNLSHADPASDPPATILAAGGVIHLLGPKGARQVAASDFFVGLLATALQEKEILTAVEIPVLAAKSGTAYLKFAHPASGYAICGAAAIVTLAADGSCEAVRLAFNGITAMTFHADAVANGLKGKPLDDATIDQVVDRDLYVDDPMGDVHASGPYRAEVAKVYAKRALKLARDRARG